MWSAGGARFESVAVLTIVPPNQTPLDDISSRGTGAEVSCVPQSESCHGAMQDAKVGLLSFLSLLCVYSPGAAPERPCPHTPHCRALLLLGLGVSQPWLSSPPPTASSLQPLQPRLDLLGLAISPSAGIAIK